MTISQSHVNLFKSFFKGREDVYAVRWEKEGRSGYMPAYKIDWIDYNQHKANGGTFSNYNKKEFLQITDSVIKDHLLGKTTVGIYPLLSDNTSYFIVVDFEKAIGCFYTKAVSLCGL